MLSLHTQTDKQRDAVHHHYTSSACMHDKAASPPLTVKRPFARNTYIEVMGRRTAVVPHCQKHLQLPCKRRWMQPKT